MPDNFIYSIKFLKSLRNSSDDVISVSKEKIRLFKTNSKDPSLKIHKLLGKLRDCWAFSINHEMRIIVELYKNTVTFLDIGDHKLYK